MWINFGIKDFIDILLVAIFLYQTYKLMKKSGTLAIFSGVVSFIIAWILVSQVLEMRLMGAIFDKFISVGFVVLVILFQDEIRRFLVALGSHRGWKFLSHLFSKHNQDEHEGKYIASVVLACKNMAKKKTGACFGLHSLSSPLPQQSRPFTAESGPFRWIYLSWWTNPFLWANRKNSPAYWHGRKNS